MPGYCRLYPDYGPGAITTTAFAGVRRQAAHGNREDDMPKQGPTARSVAGLTGAEADRRKAILGLLKDALAARRISSVLVGRRTLVLRSDQGGERCARYGEPVRPSDPQLYVFSLGDVQIVTTDGEVYWFADGHVYPAADPGGAAQVCASVSWQRTDVRDFAG